MSKKILEDALKTASKENERLAKKLNELRASKKSGLKVKVSNFFKKLKKKFKKGE